ncbi:hypothetical protein ZQ37_004436 [Salmonella enterica subsp. enterica]|nr:hypothetical protein [Salmonella enterica]EBV2538083.1 hypothetical protein [Salmonella enterica subsp. enterica serovar Agbeni]EAU1471535.1 hypothetical protein [Salmonella enterica]EBX2927909.1 hypothetical protein [Salmonella enterica subsp. enterica serovar Agbeni]EDR9150340.1 hypothetical protein [Salmonella enterica subsp. enterica serovar Agbeni]
MSWIDPLGLIKVFRNLRADESISDGLSAKALGRGMSAAGHVRNGSNDTFKGSQYISTTTDESVARQYRGPGQTTVIFDTDDVLPDVNHAGQPKPGADPRTYDFKNDRYQKINNPSTNDHHIYYDY